jgi:hypothetical protein
MFKYSVALLAGLLFLASGAAHAEVDCTPHCDYNHYYGPSNFTYVRPGLFGYPRCSASGYCAPHLAYRYSYVREPALRIVVRPHTRAKRR